MQAIDTVRTFHSMSPLGLCPGNIWMALRLTPELAQDLYGLESHMKVSAAAQGGTVRLRLVLKQGHDPVNEPNWSLQVLRKMNEMSAQMQNIISI
jgi:hypothetical protein